MDKHRVTVVPFMLAFMAGLLAMPTNVYQICAWNHGTEEIEPWRSRASTAIRAVTRAISQWFATFWTPRVRLLCAAIVLAIVVSQLTGHAQHAPFIAGLTIQDLLQEKGQLAEQAKALIGENGIRSEDEGNFNTIHEKIDKITKQVEMLAKQDAVDRSLTESQGRRSDPNPLEERSQPTYRGSLGKITERDRTEALRTWMCAGSAEFEATPQQREHARRCGINVDSKRLLIHMFAPKAMRTSEWHAGAEAFRPSVDDKRSFQAHIDEERAALTGLQSTTTTGGYTVADELMRSLEVALLAFGGMRSVATVIRTDTGGPLPIPTTNDTANKGVIIGENTTTTELEMTFGQLVLDAWKYSSKYILASMEFLQDTSINVSGFLGEALANRIGRIQNDHFTTGSGSQPNGIVTAATSSGVTFAGSATVSYDNLVDLVHSVDPAYRSNGRFMFHDGALKMIKKVKVLQYSGDTTGMPLWAPGLTAGQPDTILGYPYVINQSMTTPATTVKSILFGDFSKYIIRDVRTVEVRRLDELFALLGQTAFLAFARADGDLLDAGTNPVKYGTQA